MQRNFLAGYWFIVLLIGNVSFGQSVRAVGIEQLPKNNFLSVNQAASSDSAALFVGVNEFTKDEGLASLDCAVNDAIGQAHLFVRELRLVPSQNCILCLSGSPSTGITARQLDLLKKDGVEVRSAAKSDILNGLTVATRMPVSPADVVIVSVSSHGFEDKEGIYVMPADGLRSYLADTALRSRVLTDTISKSRAGKKIVILDACRERVDKNKSSGSGVAMTENFLRAFAAGHGQITLTSCGIGQFSYEDEKDGHGVFTGFLLEGLRGSAQADDNGFVTVGSLSQYVADGVRRWIVRNKPDVSWDKIPEPRLDASEIARMMPLAVAGNVSGNQLEKARKYWQEYRITEGENSSAASSGTDSNRRNLAILKEYYLDGRIEKEDYELAEILLATETQYLDETDKKLISAFLDVCFGRHDPERLSRLLELVEEPSERLNRKSDIPKRIKIEALLSRVHANDNKADGRRALEALGELLELDPSHSEAINLQEKIRGYYGPNPGDIITNSIGMKLVWISPGEFMMGSPSSEKERENDEIQHQVRISQGFWMGVYEVTQSQYQAVIGSSNPSHFQGDNLPVETVSWDDATEFCRKLSQKEGKTYRLPTEAQWEYACRGGTTTPFNTGETISTDQANYDGNYTYGSGRKGDYRQKTIPVGSFTPNAFGLYDMHGNVWEWCNDWGGDYPSGRVTDPVGPTTGSGRVLRGGSWHIIPRYCRSANGSRSSPGSRNHYLGFRVVVLDF